MHAQAAISLVASRAVSYRDAEVLLGFVLQISREQLIACGSSLTLTAKQEQLYLDLLSKRESGEPVAHLTGQKEFFGRPFKCDARALIPRPETEAVIELCLQAAKPFTPPLQILELGTGLGNIAITLALELTTPFQIIATDISPDALALAQENQQLLHAPPITWLEANLFDHPAMLAAAPFHIIAANLPYVHDLWKVNPIAQKEVVFYEPDIALFGGPDGLDLYRKFFQAAPQFTAPKGRIVIEHDAEQAAALTQIALQAFPTAQITSHQDYAGLDRVLNISLG